MNKVKNKFIKNLNNGVPQILSRILIADVQTPISTLIKISKDE